MAKIHWFWKTESPAGQLSPLDMLKTLFQGVVTSGLWVIILQWLTSLSNSTTWVGLLIGTLVYFLTRLPAVLLAGPAPAPPPNTGSKP